MGTTTEKIENFWAKQAYKLLVGKRIISVRYMTDAEAREFGWDHRPLVVELDSGEVFCPASTSEATDGGALYFKDEDTMPRLEYLVD